MQFSLPNFDEIRMSQFACCSVIRRISPQFDRQPDERGNRDKNKDAERDREADEHAIADPCVRQQEPRRQLRDGHRTLGGTASVRRGRRMHRAEVPRVACTGDGESGMGKRTVAAGALAPPQKADGNPGNLARSAARERSCRGRARSAQGTAVRAGRSRAGEDLSMGRQRENGR